MAIFGKKPEKKAKEKSSASGGQGQSLRDLSPTGAMDPKEMQGMQGVPSVSGVSGMSGMQGMSGMHGVRQSQGITPEMTKMLLSANGASMPTFGAMQLPDTGVQVRVGEKEVAYAIDQLTRYKQGKANLETRAVEDELWWELRHWEAIRTGDKAKEVAKLSPEPSSAWLFNSILNKHADAMDNYPEPVVLPREQSDEESAKILSSVLPVILEYNGFEDTYSGNWWEKLKHGTAIYGVFWNPQKENGLGDIDIREIDLLKLFWEPGVTDIQKSRNLFIVELVDEDILDEQYPAHKGKLGGSVVDVKQYVYDDAVDVSGKSVVVDWYYKRRTVSGRSVLHYAKMVGNILLYASENDPKYQDRGWYDHGEFPIVFDVLFPEKGTPAGFGYVAICKDPQLYIDKLSANILENSMMATKRRFFASTSTGINKEQFLDWNQPIVDVEGQLDDARLKEIVTQPLSGIYTTVLQMKIEEMKDTAANRDVNSGSAGSGVTAAAAIAALQEAGNKTSRDMIGASYRAHVAICAMCTELAAQFYDETRSFRVTGTMPGSYQFVELNNAGMKEQLLPPSYEGQEAQPGYVPIYRKPVFDIKIKAQKKNPFSRMEQNERAKELYGMGFFNPERAQEALGALEMMDFEGVEKVRERVMEGQTLLNIIKQMSAQMDQMAAIIQVITGKDMGVGGGPSGDTGMAVGAGGKESASASKGGTRGIASTAKQAQTPMTDYGANLASRSRPNMNVTNSANAPRT